MAINTLLIKRPHISEKATRLHELGQYVFMVHTKATKNEIRKAIQEVYNVHVTAVNVVNESPRRRRFRRIVSYKGRLKKAIVTLKEGEKIDLKV